MNKKYVSSRLRKSNTLHCINCKTADFHSVKTNTEKIVGLIMSSVVNSVFEETILLIRLSFQYQRICLIS